MKKMNKTRQELTDFFIRGLEEKRLPWRAVWKSGRHYNATTGVPYRGVNTLLLAAVSQQRGYADPRWCTFLQAKANRWSVKKGAKGVPVEYWMFLDPDLQKYLSWQEARQIEQDDPERWRRLELRNLIHTVFNAGDISGIPPLTPEKPAADIREIRDRRDTLLKNMKLDYRESGTEAYYNMAEDLVTLPPEDSFESAYGYVCTLLHECGHATAHPSRLNRAVGIRGAEEYAREELRAEIASAFVSQALELQMEDSDINDNLDLHKAYVQSWITLLKSNPEELFAAIREAERISDYLLEQGEFRCGQQKPYLSTPVKLDMGALQLTLKNSWAHGGYYLSVDGRDLITAEMLNEALSAYRAGVSEVHLSEGITAIGSRAFWKMPALQHAALPHSLERIGNQAFDGCTKLRTVEYSGSICEWDAITKGNRFLPEQFSYELSHNANPFESGLPDATRAAPDAVRGILRFEAQQICGAVLSAEPAEPELEL